MTNDNVRSISAIARDISRAWPKPYFGAVPYLDAMHSIERITDSYFADSAKSVVLYFLSNATTWRGDDARRIKAELKKLAGIK
jgi:hypothetical protein